MDIKLGRNNAMFTCFSEGWEKNVHLFFLDEFNSHLNYPLPVADIHNLLNSSYSGKYKGACKEYVKALLVQYIKGDSSIPVNIGCKGAWYKFKKERKDRVRSHYEEWEKNIIAYTFRLKNQKAKCFFGVHKKSFVQHRNT